MTAIRLAVLICVTSLLNGCILFMFADRSGPLRESWEAFYKNKKKDVPAEIVKQDMLGCGFDNTHNNIGMLLNNQENYVKAQLCMENKGYKVTSLPKGVCHRYPDSSACQARQKNPK